METSFCLIGEKNKYITSKSSKISISSIESSIKIIKPTGDNITFQIIKDISSAEFYWNLFSPNTNLFDNWDFRYCAYKYLQYELFFYVGFVNERPIGVFPLQWNPQNNCLEFFGGWYMEDNKILIAPGYESWINAFYEMINPPFNGKYISTNSILNKTNFSCSEYSYFVNIEQIGNFEGFIEKKFEGKKKNEFKRIVRNFYKNPELKIIENRYSDISTMFEYSLKNFEDKCDHIVNPQESKFELDLIKEFDTVLLSFCFGEKVQAVSLLINFNGVLYGINGGINYSDVNNLGKLVFAEKVNYALKHGLKMYHAGVGSYNWKEDWHLDKTPMYEFRKG